MSAFSGVGDSHRRRLDASRKEADQPGLRRDLFEAMTEVARTGQGAGRFDRVLD